MNSNAIYVAKSSSGRRLAMNVVHGLRQLRCSPEMEIGACASGSGQRNIHGVRLWVWMLFAWVVIGLGWSGMAQAQQCYQITSGQITAGNGANWSGQVSTFLQGATDTLALAGC